MEMTPRAKKYGLRYYFDKIFRRTMKRREDRVRYGSVFLNNKKAFFRKLVERSGHRCAFCGAHQDLTIDHIKRIADGGTSDLENLQLLCRPCHIKKDSDPNNPFLKKYSWNTPFAYAFEKLKIRPKQ